MFGKLQTGVGRVRCRVPGNDFRFQTSRILYILWEDLEKVSGRMIGSNFCMKKTTPTVDCWVNSYFWLQISKHYVPRIHRQFSHLDIFVDIYAQKLLQEYAFIILTDV